MLVLSKELHLAPANLANLIPLLSHVNTQSILVPKGKDELLMMTAKFF